MSYTKQEIAADTKARAKEAGLVCANDGIIDCLKRHDAALEATAKEMERLIPEGSTVGWTTQKNGDLYRHFGTVVCHRFNNPHELRVKNETTGKTSNVSITCQDFVLLARPAPRRAY